MTVAIRKSALNFFVGPNMVREGLVVQLDPRNSKSYPGSGTTVFDISREGAVCDAVFSGTHTISEDGIYLDGISGNGSFSQPSVTYASGEVLQEWSIGLFVKPDEDGGWIISPSSAGADHALRNDFRNSLWTFAVTQSTDVNNRTLNSTVGSVPRNNQWTYVMCTLKGLNMNIYINGEFNVNRINDTPIGNWTGSWRIGARAIFTGFFFRGLLDNIHVYNREISPEEIKRNFNAFKGRYDNLRNRN